MQPEIIEVVGKLVRVTDEDAVILDDDGDEIEMSFDRIDNHDLRAFLTTIIGMRISYVYGNIGGVAGIHVRCTEAKQSVYHQNRSGCFKITEMAMVSALSGKWEMSKESTGSEILCQKQDNEWRMTNWPI
jgi:hypothetical protein